MPNVAALLVLLVACGEGPGGSVAAAPTSGEAAPVSASPRGPEGPPVPPATQGVRADVAGTVPPAALEALAVPPAHSGYVAHDEYQRYDALDRAGKLTGFDAVAEKALDLRAGMAVAEIGCGPGPGMRALAARVGPTGKVYEVDVDPNAIQFIRARLARAPLLYGAPLDNVEVVQSGFDDVRLPPGSIDRAFLQQVHNYVFLPSALSPEESRAMYERENRAWTRSVHAALRPGGRMVVVEMPPSHNTGAAYGADDVVRFVEGTGYFRLVEKIDPVYEISYLLDFERVETPVPSTGR